MRAHQVQVRGCLPTIVAIVVIGVVLAAFTTVGVALLAVALAAGLLAAGIRRLRGTSRPAETNTSAARRAADVTIDAEVVEQPGSGEDRSPKRLE